MPNISPSLKELAAAIVEADGDTVQIIVGKGDDRQLTLTCNWTPEHGFEVSSDVATFARYFPPTRYQMAEEIWRFSEGKPYAGRSVRGVQEIIEFEGFDPERWELVKC